MLRALMELLTHFIDFFLHLDKHLAEVVLTYGIWTYSLLFLIVFCETGLVVTPILPGDSLLFASGAIAATGSLDPLALALLLSVAAIIGDTANYHIGLFIGPRVFQAKDSWFFKREYLTRTEKFYEKYGGKTIILARFIPIIRTFAPFLAGVGRMKYSYFISYNVVGGILWVFFFVFMGYFFSELPMVKKNFSLVILAIIVLSVMPAVIEFIRAKREGKRNAGDKGDTGGMPA